MRPPLYHARIRRRRYTSPARNLGLRLRKHKESVLRLSDFEKLSRHQHPATILRMGKGKKSSNGVNVQVGDVDRTVINASGTHFSGGVHLNLGDDADDAQETELVQPDENTMLLFRILSTKFTLEELESVCWEIGIRFENLPAKTLSGKARQLVQKVSDLNVMTKLIAIVNRERPDAGIKSLQEI